MIGDLYDEMILDIQSLDSPQETVLGCTLKRKEEDINDFIRYKSYLREYVSLGIKRYMNISFQEYLQLTTYEAKWYREIALELAEEEKEVMNNAEKNSEKKIKRMQDANGLNELLNGEF